MRLITFLVLTTFFWGVAAIFDKLALGKVAPFSGMLVRQFILIGIMLLVAVSSGRLGSLWALDGRSIFFFGLSGICGGIAGLWTYYHALRLGGASLVVPITATYPLVTAILSCALLQEGFTFRRFLGTALIVFGVWLVK
jgi:transporter family protein